MFVKADVLCRFVLLAAAFAVQVVTGNAIASTKICEQTRCTHISHAKVRHVLQVSPLFIGIIGIIRISNLSLIANYSSRLKMHTK